MNLTVGPLPSAVYWRRRAVVLGGLLLALLLFVAMCNGSGSSGAASRQPAENLAASTGGSPSDTPTLLAPIIGAGSPEPDLSASAGATGVPAPPAAAPVGAPAPPCADVDIMLIPSIQPIQGGTYPYLLKLKIKNASAHTCTRDVGAIPQELHIVPGTGSTTLWSSDHCPQSGPASDVRTFGPGIETPSFSIGWDGSQGTKCSNATKLGPGTYRLIARLDTKVSSPVAFTVAGTG